MIALTTKVNKAIEYILEDNGTAVMQPGDGKIYVLDVSLRHFGTLQYTVFDETTQYPLASFQVRFGNQHIMHQVLFGSMNRLRLGTLLTTSIPGQIKPVVDPLIIPTLTAISPTTVKPK